MKPIVRTTQMYTIVKIPTYSEHDPTYLEWRSQPGNAIFKFVNRDEATRFDNEKSARHHTETLRGIIPLEYLEMPTKTG